MEISSNLFGSFNIGRYHFIFFLGGRSGKWAAFFRVFFPPPSTNENTSRFNRVSVKKTRPQVLKRVPERAKQRGSKT